MKKKKLGRPLSQIQWTRFHMMLDQGMTERFNAFLAANPMTDKAKVFRAAMNQFLTNGGF